MVEESACQYRRHRGYGFDPWFRKIPWSRKWQPHSSFLGWQIPRTGEAWQATVHGVAKSQTGHTHTHTHGGGGHGDEAGETA